MKSKKEKKMKSETNGEQEGNCGDDITTSVPCLDIDVGNHEIQKEKKKKKKKMAEDNQTNDLNDNDRGDGSKEEKKKKKRKNEHGEDNNGQAETNGEEKQKKKKKRQNENVNISFGNYIPHPDVENMSISSADSYRQEHNLTITPPEVADYFKPINSFSQLIPSLQDYCPEVLRYLEMKNFPHPSPIQVDYQIFI